MSDGNHVKLAGIRENAQRALDGMSHNKDKLATDAMRLCDTVERAMALIREQEAELKKLRGDRKPLFGSTFDDIFGSAR
jgi:hypothetical protein